MGTIFNIQRYCLHDGDGIRTNVFFKGCPLRCKWCHNPEGLDAKPTVAFNEEKCTVCGKCVEVCGIRSIDDGKLHIERALCIGCNRCVDVCLNGANEVFGREVTADEVMNEVLKDRVYYMTSKGGMTLSGGEPSMQPEFALELIQRAKNEGVTTFIETCGIGGRSFYKKAFELGASFLYDIKCMDVDKHKKLTGVSNGNIISNLEFLFENGADVIVRLPLVPGINDLDDDIEKISEFLLKHKGKYRYAEIMAYHSFGVAKAQRIGKDGIHGFCDATSDDKERWQRSFLEKGIDTKISQ